MFLESFHFNDQVSLLWASIVVKSANDVTLDSETEEGLLNHTNTQ